ncbi:MAG: hypothetical protein AAF993_04575 [Pseudomonadota bacterium]
MSIQDLGSLGELIAALATILTLIYLAIQVRQNTRALKASTFQSISSELIQNVQPVLMTPDMASIYAKSLNEPDSLSPAEVIKMQAMYMANFRRLESTFVQSELGSIDRAFVEGPELSLLAVINTQNGRAWWESANALFYPPFVKHVESQLDTNTMSEKHPGMRVPGS